jgi:NADPH:quinone reductase-like Zn-dependent oxidoreductase
MSTHTLSHVATDSRDVSIPAKVVQLSRFGGVEALAACETIVPPPGRGELRVRTRAVSLNPIDGKIRRGELTFLSGKRFPMGIGAELSGVVEAVGKGVSRWQVGDEIAAFAEMRAGALGELVVVKAHKAIAKPKNVSFSQAACFLVGIASLQSLRDLARVQKGDRILVNGAGGGMGLSTVQLAKRMGAHVTATCTGKAMEVVAGLGADVVVDYRKRDVTKEPARYAAILDFATAMPFAKARAILDRNGVHVDPSPTPGKLIGNFFANLFRAQKAKSLMSGPVIADYSEVARLAEKKEWSMLVDRTFPLSEVQEAYRHAESGGIVGKVVVEVST